MIDALSSCGCSNGSTYSTCTNSSLSSGGCDHFWQMVVLAAYHIVPHTSLVTLATKLVSPHSEGTVRTTSISDYLTHVIAIIWIDTLEALLCIIIAGPHILLQAIIRTISPISLPSHMHMERHSVIGGSCGAPLLAVRILKVCARVIPHPINNERKPAVPLLSTSLLFDSACYLPICANNGNA